MHPEAEHAEMKQILKRNTELLEENNRLLRKLHRNAIWGFWLRVLFYGLFLGVPVVLYFYFVQPYLESMGDSYESIMLRFEQIPNFDAFNRMFDQPE